MHVLYVYHFKGFKFVSKTIYNKPFTTNQKPNFKKKKERNKRHEINKIKMEINKKKNTY
jgi:hypothetical protein